MAKPAIEAVSKLIVNKGPHNQVPLEVIDDAPKVTFPVVKLDTPPNYKLGEKVVFFNLLFFLREFFII